MTQRLLLVCVLLLLAVPGRANGRYPAASQLVRNPLDSAHLIAQTTYGFLQTTDAGQSWHWICEVSVGYDGQQDPFIGIMGNGNVLAATAQGLSMSVDRGCGWQKAVAPEYLGRLPAIDLIVDPHEPKHALVLSVAADETHHQLMATHDDGQTWTQIGQALPDNAEGLTLEMAPSRAARLYVSGRVGANRDQHALLRSDDGGTTWTTLPFHPTMTDAAGIPLPADQTQVLGTYIGAVDPAQPDTVWLRVRRSFNPDQVWRTQDGGETWHMAFQAPKGKLFGFALSPDGQQIAVGSVSPNPGLWRAAAGDLAFQHVNDMSTHCLKWLDDGLYICADEVLDGMTLGVSADAGDHFTAVHHRADLSQLTCPGTSRTSVLCGNLWPLVAYEIGVGAQSSVPPAAHHCQAAPTGAPMGMVAGGAMLLAAWALRRHRVSATSQAQTNNVDGLPR